MQRYVAFTVEARKNILQDLQSRMELGSFSAFWQFAILNARQETFYTYVLIPFMSKQDKFSQVQI